MTTATRPDDIRDVHLSGWVARKTEKWTEGHWGQCDYDESAWRTFRTIIDEFGVMYPKFPRIDRDGNVDGEIGAQTIIGRYIARMPREKRDGGVDYSHPYSLGLHLCALREYQAKVRAHPDFRPRAQAVPYSSQDAERVSFSDSSVRTS